MGDFICEWKSRTEQKKRKVCFRGAYEVYETMLNQNNWVNSFSGKTLSENWEIYREIEKKLSDKNIPLASPREQKCHETMEKQTSCLEESNHIQ